MRNHTESAPQEIKPHRGNGVEKVPADPARPLQNHATSTTGKAEDMVALLADRMRRGGEAGR